MSKMTCRIGIDLGGTKIEGIALDREDACLANLRIATPRGDYDATIRAIVDLVAKLTQGAARSQDYGGDAGGRDVGGSDVTIGVGIPGSISPKTRTVQNANSTWLNGRAFDLDLGAALAAQIESRDDAKRRSRSERRTHQPSHQLGRGLDQQRVRCANDANCFALSEASDGAGADARSLFGVILGTGCGGAMVRDKQIIDGPRGIGGEWGHNPLPRPDSRTAAGEVPGPLCWCGRRGCMETFVSGPGLAKDHARVTGETLSAEEIAARAAGGDGTAQATLTRHASRLARGLASVVNLFDPDIIVLGGGLSQMPHLYTQLPKLMAPHIFSDDPSVTIAPPKWGDASGMRGAARLWD